MAARKIRRTCLSAQTKFSVQPFSKGWQIPKAAPLVAFRRKRNPPMLPKDQEGMGNPIKGFPKRQGCFEKGEWAGRRGSYRWHSGWQRGAGSGLGEGGGFAGLRPAGNPLIGFPSAGQPTGLSGLPFLILLDHWGISPSAEGDLGALPPRPLPAFWEKAGSKTWFAHAADGSCGAP